jgi:hypothetical protein
VAVAVVVVVVDAFVAPPLAALPRRRPAAAVLGPASPDPKMFQRMVM